MLIGSIALVVASIQMANVAHRGLWKEARLPQNTVEAIKAAYDAGAQIVETDFSLTTSGEMICIHDRKALATMSSIVKEPSQITPEDREVINLGEKMGLPRPYRIPLLSEVLAVVPKDRILQAEIKVYGKTYAKRFDDAVKAAGLAETNIVISGFNEKALTDFHWQFPAYRILWLGCGIADKEFDLAAVIEKAKKAGFDVVCPGCKAAMKAGLRSEDVERIRSAGLDFRLFGVNNKEELAYAARLGASGFTCDRFKSAYDWAKDIGGITLLPLCTNGSSCASPESLR